MFRDAILKNYLIYNFKLIYYYIQNKYLFIKQKQKPARVKALVIIQLKTNTYLIFLIL